MSYYTPYKRDMKYAARRQANRSSSAAKLLWLIVWFILIMIFV